MPFGVSTVHSLSNQVERLCYSEMLSEIRTITATFQTSTGFIVAVERQFEPAIYGMKNTPRKPDTLDKRFQTLCRFKNSI
jgi:hypothetical protein